MKYYLHDTTAFQDDKVTLLYMKYGYEAVGLFYCILEKIAKQEKPVAEEVLKTQLYIKNRLQKQLNYMYEIGILSLRNGDVFNENLLSFSKKYQIKKEKTRKRVEEWRAKQQDVTCYVPVSNTFKVNKSKVKEIYKENGKFKPPTLDEIKQYVKDSNINNFDSERYYNSRESTGWEKMNGAKVKNWKNDLRNAISWCIKEKIKPNGGLVL